MPSEHLLRQAPKRGTGEAGAESWGKMVLVTFAETKVTRRTGRVMCRMHKCRGRMDALERPPRLHVVAEGD